MQSFLQYRTLGHVVRKELQDAREGPRAPRVPSPHHVKGKPETPSPTDSDDVQPTPSNADARSGPGSDALLVHSRGPTDGTNAAEWPLVKRYSTTAVLWILVFALGWVSACDSNIIKKSSAEFGVSETAETLATALFFLGISIGALAAGSISETVGRTPVYLASILACTLFTLGTALAPNYGAQISLRFLAGVGASATLSMYGGSLADLFSDKERGLVWPVFALSPVLGPAMSPLAGGWIDSSNIYWRWVYWISFIFSFVVLVLALVLLPETFTPVLLDWKARHYRKLTGDVRYKSAQASPKRLASRLKDSVFRSAKFFHSEPIIVCLGAYLIFIYVVNFTFLNGFDFIFKDTYGLSPGITALGFVSILGGALFNTLLTPAYSALHKRLLHRRNLTHDTHNPAKTPSSDATAPGPEELHIVPAAIAAPFLAISLFWLGWTNNASITPASGYIATAVFGYALTAIFVSSYMYIIESYGEYAGSALASITTARYFVSAGMVVASRPMYQGIGVHWTLTFLGGLAVLLVPVPVLVLWRGRPVRVRSDFANGEE